MTNEEATHNRSLMGAMALMIRQNYNIGFGLDVCTVSLSLAFNDEVSSKMKEVGWIPPPTKDGLVWRLPLAAAPSKAPAVSRLDDVRKRLNEATPGPWGRDDRFPRLVLFSDSGSDPGMTIAECTTEEDATFILHARGDMEELRSECESLRERLIQAAVGLNDLSTISASGFDGTPSARDVEVLIQWAVDYRGEAGFAGEVVQALGIEGGDELTFSEAINEVGMLRKRLVEADEKAADLQTRLVEAEKKVGDLNKVVELRKGRAESALTKLCGSLSVALGVAPGLDWPALLTEVKNLRKSWTIRDVRGQGRGDAVGEFCQALAIEGGTMEEALTMVKTLKESAWDATKKLAQEEQVSIAHQEALHDDLAKALGMDSSSWGDLIITVEALSAASSHPAVAAVATALGMPHADPAMVVGALWAMMHPHDRQRMEERTKKAT